MKKIITIIVALSLLAMGSACIAAGKGDQGETKHHRQSHHGRMIEKASNEVVNINEANAETFASLKGIGKKKAEAIVNYRKENGNFTTLNDLAKVKGIGAKTVARLLKNNPGRLVIN